MTYVDTNSESWWESTGADGYIGLYWNTEGNIQSIYEAECGRITQMGGNENNWGGCVNVIILRITDTPGRLRHIYFRVYG